MSVSLSAFQRNVPIMTEAQTVTVKLRFNRNMMTVMFISNPVNSPLPPPQARTLAVEPCDSLLNHEESLFWVWGVLLDSLLSSSFSSPPPSLLAQLRLSAFSHQECEVQDPGCRHRSGAPPQRRRAGHPYSQESGVLCFPHGEPPPPHTLRPIVPPHLP